MFKIAISVICSLFLCFSSASARDLTPKQLNNIKNLFEKMVLQNNNQSGNNFCRIIKNLGKDEVSCEIYQSYKDGHSEIATRFDIEVTSSNEEAPIKPPLAQKKVNNYIVQIWQDKVYAGPKRPEALVETYIAKLTKNLKITLTCWENHNCYAAHILNNINRQQLTQIVGN